MTRGTAASSSMCGRSFCASVFPRRGLCLPRSTYMKRGRLSNVNLDDSTITWQVRDPLARRSIDSCYHARFCPVNYTASPAGLMRI